MLAAADRGDAARRHGMASRELIANRQRQEGRRLPANATANAAVRSAVSIEQKTARSRWAGLPQGRKQGAVASPRRRGASPP
jgi:hypothetical protein